MWGGTFASFGPGGNVCQQMAKYQFPSIIVCRFLGPENVSKRPLLGTYILLFFVDIGSGLPGPLRTAFKLKIALPKAKKQPDATALAENAINWLKHSKHV